MTSAEFGYVAGLVGTSVAFAFAARLVVTSAVFAFVAMLAWSVFLVTASFIEACGAAANACSVFKVEGAMPTIKLWRLGLGRCIPDEEGVSLRLTQLRLVVGSVMPVY